MNPFQVRPVHNNGRARPRARRVRMAIREFHTRHTARGFTLVELLVVVSLVALVAAIAAQRLGGTLASAKRRAAESEMALLRDVISGSAASPGYLADMSPLPGYSPAYLRIGNLLAGTNLYGRGGARVDDGTARTGYAPAAAFSTWSEERSRGWRGPYLAAGAFARGTFPSRDERPARGGPAYGDRGFFPSLSRLALPDVFVDAVGGCSVYGFAGEPALFDPWGAPYVVQVPPPQAFDDVTGVTEEERFRYARIVSAGPDGRLSTPCFFANATNRLSSSWTPAAKRLSRLAGRTSRTAAAARGDDLVLFLCRQDSPDPGE